MGSGCAFLGSLVFYHTAMHLITVTHAVTRAPLLRDIGAVTNTEVRAAEGCFGGACLGEAKTDMRSPDLDAGAELRAMMDIADGIRQVVIVRTLLEAKRTVVSCAV